MTNHELRAAITRVCYRLGYDFDRYAVNDGTWTLRVYVTAPKLPGTRVDP